MTAWTLLRTNLARNPIRTALASISLVVAFLLFMLLRSISAMFADAADESDTLLLVQAKFLSGYMLPITHADKIRSLRSVQAVTPMMNIGGYYQDPKNSFGTYAVFPDDVPLAFKTVEVDAEALSRFQQTRIGALVTEVLAEAEGWQVGDAVTIQSRFYSQEEGDRNWVFEVSGILKHKPGKIRSPQFIFQYDYFEEASSVNKNVTGVFYVVADKPENVPRLIRDIDSLLDATPQPTNTVTRDYASRSYARRLGDVGQIATLILGAVFFTVLLVTGNGAAQAMRERMSEYAAMQTIGFSRRYVITLILAENILLCVLCAVVGIAAAHALGPIFKEHLSAYFGQFDFTWQISALTVVIAVVTGVVISFLPIMDTLRRNIVNALQND